MQGQLRIDFLSLKKRWQGMRCKRAEFREQKEFAEDGRHRFQTKMQWNLIDKREVHKWRPRIVFFHLFYKYSFLREAHCSDRAQPHRHNQLPRDSLSKTSSTSECESFR